MSHTPGLEEASRKNAIHCGNCGRAIYFGGAYWWHSHSESMFCDDNTLHAYPAAYDDPSVGKQLLDALKIAQAAISGVGRNPKIKTIYFTDDERETINAAIAKATGGAA